MAAIEREIIACGKRIFERRLTSGWGGNISVRLGRGRFLITGQHASMGSLRPADLVVVNGDGKAIEAGRRPSSETPLHLAIYRKTGANAVIHAHPPATLVFSLGGRSFSPLSFEEQYLMGKIPNLAQGTATVEKPAAVVEVLRFRPIVILGGHGTVARGKDLTEAFLFTDLLEQAIYCRTLLNDALRSRQKSQLARFRDKPALFSREHLVSLIDSANRDVQFQRLAREQGAETTLTFVMQELNLPWTLFFENGVITRLENSDEGALALSGPAEVWLSVFQGRRGFSAAARRGLLKVKRGGRGELERWSKLLNRGFGIWQSLAVK
jgi:L-fuculose-phosphate aldolase